MLYNFMRPGSRKLTAFFTSMGTYLMLMMLVIIVLHPANFSLETFAVSLAAGIMAISYGFYASNAYVNGEKAKGKVKDEE